ncbi:MAG: hypothetical protein AAGK17_00225 [Pseudomonadota bacterium]
MKYKGITRRGALGRCAGAGLAVISGTSEKASAAGTKIPLPGQPMRLSRVLTRDLKGPATLRVARDWQVEFANQDQGIAMVGLQLSARVDAPQEIAQLAGMEEKRDTNGLFPILLSDEGIIIAAGTSMREVDLAKALQQADMMIANMPIQKVEKARHRLFLSQLQRSGSSAMDHIPPDLFFPKGMPIRSVEDISLPGNVKGHFEVRYDAYSRAGQPWLHRAIREVVTRIGGDERRSIEEWSLEPLVGTGR